MMLLVAQSKLYTTTHDHVAEIKYHNHTAAITLSSYICIMQEAAGNTMAAVVATAILHVYYLLVQFLHDPAFLLACINYYIISF